MSGPPDLTVLVVIEPGTDPAAIAATCADLDAQSLATARFEIVLVSGGALPDRIHRWRERRANVTEAGDRPAALAGATGQHVVTLGPDTPLFAFGLQVLAVTLGASDADVVVAVCNDDWRSAQWLARPDQRPTTAGSIVAIRRELAVELAAEWSVESVDRALSGGASVAVAPRPLARSTRLDPWGPTPAHTNLDQLSVRWSGPRLQLAVTVTVVDPDRHHPDSRPAPEGEPVVMLVARAQRVPVERSLPVDCDCTRTGLDDGWRLVVRADLDLDPTSSVLPVGRWLPLLRIVWPDREVFVPIPGPAKPVPSALLSGRPVEVRSVRGALLIDQARTTGATVGALRASDSRLTESAAGLILEVDLPDLHAVGAASLPGQLMVGGQVGPATVVCAEGRATLVAYLSPAAGRAEIGTLFGGPRTPSGLDLETALDGSSLVVPHYREAPFRRPEPEPTAEPLRPGVPRPAAAGPTVARRAYRSLRRRVASLRG